MWPSTIAGWAGLVLAVLSSLAIILAVVIRLARQHIDNRINKTLELTVRTAVLDGMAPINVRLGNIDLQLVTQDGELARVRRIEQQINNGLADRQARIEDKMDTIIDHITWNGEERRDPSR